ncbi:MAG: acyltransferase [Bacteroidales bacterium]|nr:acyltransferase [Bacteroidales bacterium]MBQ5423993.1 acyltransferase [Bacteroidales bacterium]
MEHRQFDTFDALRFFACLKVFLLHIPIVAFPVFSFLKAEGGIGVIMFFALSGFLISYILLSEKESTGKVNLKRFYLKRSMRICPLFYAMLLFAFCTPFILNMLHLPSSSEGYEPNWLMSVLFLENYKSMVENCDANVAPLAVMWSLCIEMHFYLVWGLTVKFAKMKHIPIIFALIIVIANVARIVLFAHDLNTCELLSNFDYFIYGAIPAYCLVKYGDKMENFVNRIPVLTKWLSIIVAIALVVIAPLLSDMVKVLIMPTLWGVSFGWTITLFTPRESRFKISQGNILSRLGRYTYGFYLFHLIWIMLLVKVFDMFGLSLDNIGWATLMLVLAFSTTMATAWASYNLFEKRFIRFASRKSKV